MARQMACKVMRCLPREPGVIHRKLLRHHCDQPEHSRESEQTQSLEIGGESSASCPLFQKANRQNLKEIMT